jgi:hypothetical protein
VAAVPTREHDATGMSGHARTITRTRWISVLIAINALAVTGAVAGVAVAPTGTRMVVIAPPWSEPGRIMQIVAAAGGSLVDGGARDWIVLAESGERGFAARLVAAGALLVLDGRLGKSCFDLGN